MRTRVHVIQGRLAESEPHRTSAIEAGSELHSSDTAASRAPRQLAVAARARIHARNAKREWVDVLPKRKGGWFGVPSPERRQARACGAVVRCWRSGSPNRGPPKTTQSWTECTERVTPCLPGRRDRVERLEFWPRRESARDLGMGGRRGGDRSCACPAGLDTSGLG